MQAFEWMIGLRYTRAKSRNQFISIISLISMLGIALGVMALIVVLSVMNGFQHEIRARILGVVAHVQVVGNAEGLAAWEQVMTEARQHPQVRAAAPYVDGQALISGPEGVKGAMVRGILPEAEAGVNDIATHMKAGRLSDLQADTFTVVLGEVLANQLGVGVGDKITLITPQGQVTPTGMVPRLKQFRVVGVFKMDMFEYDATLALVPMADAQKLYRLGDVASGVRLKLDDVLEAKPVAQQLTRLITVPAWVQDWTQQHANYFRAVQLEKRMMFIILTLIVAVAAFNLVSTLVMAVTDKQADIAILRTLGASPGSIVRIFVIQGATIGLAGTLLGVVGGVLIAYNIDVIVPAIERLLGGKVLPSDVYLITDLPSDPQARDIVGVGLISLVMSLLATLYPSWRAAQVDPAEALRHE